MMGSVGGIIYPTILRFVFMQYGFRGGMLIVGAVMSHTYISAVLFHSETRNYQHVDKEPDHCGDYIQLDEPSSCPVRLETGFSILVASSFMFAAISKMVHFASICVDILQQPYDVTNLLLVMAVADLVFRLLAGVLMDLLDTTHAKVNTYLLIVFSFGSSFLLFVLSSSIVDMYIAALALAMFTACCFSQIIHVAVLIASTADHGGIKQTDYSQTVGKLRLFQGIGALLGPPLTGLTKIKRYSLTAIIRFNRGSNYCDSKKDKHVFKYFIYKLPAAMTYVELIYNL